MTKRTADILIDGSIGEGGGQILRTSLGLSMVTGKSFRIQRIRAGRDKPGLLRQHLTAVLAAASICGAEVEGASISSQELTFRPGEVRPGEYTFSVGTAGSTMLVLQAVLPALLTAGGATSLTLEGGTHNPFAPPVDFLEKAFLPLMRRMGPQVHVSVERAGFYPAGGGRVFVNVDPTRTLAPLRLDARGAVTRKLAKAVVAGLPGSIGVRELEKIGQLLDLSEDQMQIRQLPAEWGPGNVLTVEIDSEHVTEVFTGFGMKGVSAEAVAEAVARDARRYLGADAPVGLHLADQLLVPLALAGEGSFTTLEPTRHTTTNCEVIQRFLPISITSQTMTKGRVTLSVQAS
jgi:RNA 3'-terminal phosphate cyclase (ATP)